MMMRLLLKRGKLVILQAKNCAEDLKAANKKLKEIQINQFVESLLCLGGLCRKENNNK